MLRKLVILLFKKQIYLNFYFLPNIEPIGLLVKRIYIWIFDQHTCVHNLIILPNMAFRIASIIMIIKLVWITPLLNWDDSVLLNLYSAFDLLHHRRLRECQRIIMTIDNNRNMQLHIERGRFSYFAFPESLPASFVGLSVPPRHRCSPLTES